MIFAEQAEKSPKLFTIHYSSFIKKMHPEGCIFVIIRNTQEAVRAFFRNLSGCLHRRMQSWYYHSIPCL